MLIVVLINGLVNLVLVNQPLQANCTTAALGAWPIGLVLLVFVLVVIPKDVKHLRETMAQRAQEG